MNQQPERTIESYVVGFVLSVLLTLSMYVLVIYHLLTGGLGIAVLLLLALLQAVVQLVFFLHLGREQKPRWRLFVLGFMVLILLILVVGSLWIMNNLNYRMTPTQIQQYLNDQTGI